MRCQGSLPLGTSWTEIQWVKEPQSPVVAPSEESAWAAPSSLLYLRAATVSDGFCVISRRVCGESSPGRLLGQRLLL